MGKNTTPAAFVAAEWSSRLRTLHHRIFQDLIITRTSHTIQQDIICGC